MAEAKNNVNAEVSSVKKEEQIVQRIVELLNERGYEYERDARPIIYWKYDVKSSRELTVTQKEEVLEALEKGEFEQWGIEYKTKVLDQQMDIVREIEKMNGAPRKIELDSKRNVAVATEVKGDSEKDVPDAKTQSTPVKNQADKQKTTPSKIVLKKPSTSESSSQNTNDQDVTTPDSSQVRLLPKKEDAPKEDKKKLLKAEQVKLDVKPKSMQETQPKTDDDPQKRVNVISC